MNEWEEMDHSAWAHGRLCHMKASYTICDNSSA